MIEFDITEQISGGLYAALCARNLDTQPSFYLDIEEGPIVRYLNSIPVKFVRTFHIGCSLDARPPNFEYSANNVTGYYEQEITHTRIPEEVFFSYSRELNKNAGILYPRDKDGERDLETTAREMSDINVYNEELCIGWLGRSRRGVGGICTRAMVHVSRNALIYAEGFDHLQGMRRNLLDRDFGYLRDVLRQHAEGSVFDFHSGPNKGNEVLTKSRIRGEELKKLDLPADRIVYEFAKLFRGAVGDATHLHPLRLAMDAETDEYFAHI